MKDPDKFNELDFIVNYIPYRIVLILVFAAAYFMVFDSKLDLNGDNAAYYNLGKALADGKGYVNTSSPGNPAEKHFPVGYPALLSALIKAGFSDFTTLKFFNGLLFFLSGMLWFDILKKLTRNKNLAFVTVIALFLSPLLMRFSTIIMSEIPFLFTSTIVFFGVLRSDRKNTSPLKRFEFYLACLAAAAGFYVKTLGFVAIGAMFGHYFFRKDYRTLLVNAAVITPLILPAFLKSSGGENYIRQLLMVNPYRPEAGFAGLSDFLERIADNAFNYGFGVIQNSVFPLSKKWLGEFIFIDVIIGALILFLIYRGIKRTPAYRAFMLSFLGLTAFVLLLWPTVWTGPRFIVHAVPVLIFFFFSGLTEYSARYEHLFSKKKPLGVYPVFLLSLLSIIPLNTERLKSDTPYPLPWQKYFDIADHARKHTPEESVFIARKPHLFHLRSERKAVNYKNTANDTVQMDHFIERGADYVILDHLGYGSTPEFLFPALQKHAICFKNELAYPDAQTFLLKFDRELYLSEDYYKILESERDSIQTRAERELDDEFLKE